MKAKKLVYSPSNLIHMFANKVDCTGFKTPTKLRWGDAIPTRQLFVMNDVLYSYGFHYPMAKWENRLLLVSSKKSTNTTEKHKSELIHGLPDIQSFVMIPNVEDAHDPRNIQYLKNVLVEKIEDIFSRKIFCDLSQVHTALVKHNLFAETFGLDLIKLPKELVDVLNNIDSENAKKRAIHRTNLKEKYELQRVKRIEERKLNTIKWLAGESVNPYSCYSEVDLIRIKGDQVQTIRGVTIDLNVAIAAYKSLLAGSLKVGDKIDHYKVEYIGENTLKIGCHTLKLDQIKEVFDTLK